MTVRKEKAKIKLTLPPREASAVDFIALGESSLDLVSVVPAFPAADGKTTATRFDLHPGGQAATAAVACARQGWRARYIGCLGADAWGDRIEDALRREGVDVAVRRPSGAATRTAAVLVEAPTGRRTVIEHRDPRLRLAPQDLDPALIRDGRVLLVDATEPDAAIVAARLARDAGMPTLVDVDRAAAGVEDLLAQIDVLIAPAHFVATLTGEHDPMAGVRAIAARFRTPIAVATLGARGSVAWCDDTGIDTAAPVVLAADTTGAGDAFRGGFVAGWLHFGEVARLDRVLEWANATAALNCVGLGAQAGLPDRAAVDALVTGAYRDQSK